jgi:uncharacterized Fe-S cluster protein YjdI
MPKIMILRKEIIACGHCPYCKYQGGNEDFRFNGHYCHHESLKSHQQIVGENAIFHGDAHLELIMPDWCPLEDEEKIINEHSKKRLKDAIKAVNPIPKAEETIWAVAKLMFSMYGDNISVFWSPDDGEVHFEGFEEADNVCVDVKVWNGKT